MFIGGGIAQDGNQNVHVDKCRSLRPGEPADPTEKGVDAPDCRRYEGALQSVRQAVSAAPAEKAVKRRAVSADGGKLPDLPCASEGQEFCLTVAGNCCTPCAAAAANGAAELAKRLGYACGPPFTQQGQLAGAVKDHGSSRTRDIVPCLT